VERVCRFTTMKTNLESFLERNFYFFMSLLIAAVVVYGFSQTVEKKLLHAAPPRPLMLYVHGIVFFGWVFFFSLQSALARTHRIQWHQQIGWFGAGLGVAMFVIGVATAITMARFNRVNLHSRYPEANLLISFFDISAFAIPFALAIYWRKKTEFHRRLQFLAICALTAAAFGRFLPSLLSPSTRHSPTALAFSIWVTLYAGVDALVLIAVARDQIVNRRVHPVYLYGLLAFIACQTLVLYTVVHRSAWWMKTAQAILG
jgi:hypothetical protein